VEAGEHEVGEDGERAMREDAADAGGAPPAAGEVEAAASADARAAADAARAERERREQRVARTRATQASAQDRARAQRSSAGDQRERDRDERAPAVVEPGFLTLDAMPYATIRVGGDEIGDTPIIRHALPPGDHVVEVQFSTGEVTRMRVAIEPGDVVRRRITP
jgi:hypothetical protein